MKCIYVALLLFCSIVVGYGQNYLDFYFKAKSVNGAIIITNEDNTFFATNREIEGKRESPPSNLFHLVAYLMIYDFYSVENNKKTLEWDGVKRYFFNEEKENWNRKTNLNDAFLNKNDWYFQEYLSDFKKEHIQAILKDIDYSNANWQSDIPYYWQFGGLLVTANQQLSFLKKLAKKELPFSVEAQENLLSLLKINQTSSLKIYGTDGYTIYLGERIDWFTGFVNKDGKNYFFTTRTYHTIDNEMDDSHPNKKFVITSEIFDVLYLL